MDYEFLSKTALFTGCSEKEIGHMLICLKHSVKKYSGLFNMSLADKGSDTYNNGKCYHVPAKDVINIVDTTGCGDSYHAGFVCSHMINGDIIEAMKIGTEFATETLSHYGGF